MNEKSHVHVHVQYTVMQGALIFLPFCLMNVHMYMYSLYTVYIQYSTAVHVLYIHVTVEVDAFCFTCTL